MKIQYPQGFACEHTREERFVSVPNEIQESYERGLAEGNTNGERNGQLKAWLILQKWALDKLAHAAPYSDTRTAQETLDIANGQMLLLSQGIGQRSIVPGKEMDDLLYDAWAVIANVCGGDWHKESEDWVSAAVRWRDRFHGIMIKPTNDRDSGNSSS